MINQLPIQRTTAIKTNFRVSTQENWLIIIIAFILDLDKLFVLKLRAENDFQLNRKKKLEVFVKVSRVKILLLLKMMYYSFPWTFGTIWFKSRNKTKNGRKRAIGSGLVDLFFSFERMLSRICCMCVANEWNLYNKKFTGFSIQSMVKKLFSQRNIDETQPMSQIRYIDNVQIECTDWTLHSYKSRFFFSVVFKHIQNDWEN